MPHSLAYQNHLAQRSLVFLSCVLGWAMNAKIVMKSGDSFQTQIDTSIHTPHSLADRMNLGGKLVIEENRWGQRRVIILQCSRIESIVLSDEQSTRHLAAA
jgi:hypothetical protein